MEHMATSWTLILLRLLGAINWSWQPVFAQYTITESYLNGEHRPLWILEDQLLKRERENRPEADYATSTRATTQRQSRAKEPAAITFLVRTGSTPTTASPIQVAPQRRFMLPRRVQLPHQYVQPLARRPARARSMQRYRAQRRRHQLPIFDNAPGDNALMRERNYPIFVYNGTKGELIVNTMLSTQRYPMQEPVPGQVLYPPSTPMFRPKPIVERFRMPGQREMLNLTLIPFYAHEAIRPTIATITTTTTTTTTTTEAPPITTPTMASYETQLLRSSKRKKMKKAKQYNAYHSPEEVVQWQPLIDSSSPSTYDTADNHRHFTIGDSMEMQQESLMEEDDAPKTDDDSLEQQSKLDIEMDETSSNNPISAFHIVYVDESLEPPADSTISITTPTSIINTTPTPIPRQSSRYALKREYFAFPVYTLGKLLQNPSTASASTQHVITTESGLAKCTEEDCNENSVESLQEPNTWFILNSRYKGPHHHPHQYGQQNGKAPKYYTSKYIQSVSRPRR